MKLMVVEDEKVIRNGLLKHVPWQKLGVWEVQAAENGEKALELAETFHPDIVLSDIRMPGMSGIELCRTLREKYPEIEIIFSTGYADKEYLKVAIDLHAVGYVEKPVNANLLAENVKEAVKRVGERRKNERAKLRNYLLELDTDVSMEQADGTYFRIVRIHFDREGCGNGFLPMFEKELKAAFLQHDISMTATLLDPFCLILLLGSEEEKRWKKIEPILLSALNKFTSDGTLGGYFVSNGTRGSGKEEILRSYHEAKEAAKALSWLGWGKSVCFEEVPPELPWESEWKQDGKKQLDVFYHLLMEKEKKEACRFQKNLYEELVRRHMHMSSTVRYIYCQMQEMLEKAAEYFYPGNMEKPWEQNGTDFFWQAETFAEMRDEMIRRIEQLLKRSEDGKEKKKTENSFTISKVTEYIQEHYAETDLSIARIADSVYLTPTYLSAVFKKQTGLTIGQYLLGIRVEHAKQKMKDPQLKFYQMFSLLSAGDSQISGEDRLHGRTVH